MCYISEEGMTLLCLLLLLSKAIQGHPAPGVPVDDGPQAADCDTLRALHLSLQAALAESGQGVQASGQDKFYLSWLSYTEFLLHRSVYH